jgi:hypothetical protein
LPRSSRLGNGLIRPGFIFIELHDPGSFRLFARQLNQSFFSGVCSS